MDPQKLSQLDPKLREAYQRVMGTSIPEPQAAPVQAQTPPPPSPTPDPTSTVPQPQKEPEPTPTPIPPVQPPAPEPEPISTPQPTMPQPVSQPQPAIPQPEPIPTQQPIPQQPSVQTTNFDQMNSEVAATQSQNFTAPAPMPAVPTMAVKKKNHLLPILIGFAGLIFIAIYTLFWTKIFNFKLPFLP